LVDRREAVMVKEIATQCFIEQRVVSGQLLQLRNKGYVVARANGRESFYELTEVLMRLCMEVKKYRGKWVELFVDFLRIWYRPAERQGKLAMLRGNGGLISDEHLELALMSDADPVLVVVSRELQNSVEKKDRNLAMQILAELQAIGGMSEERGQQISELVNAGKFDEVREILDEKVDLDFSDLNNLADLEFYSDGIMLYCEEKWLEALVVFDRALEINTDNAFLFLRTGDCLHNLGRYEEAISSYNRAIEINPSENESWYKKYLSLRRLGRYEEAISSYDREIDLDPNNHEFWSDNGILFLNRGKYLDSIDCYDRAIKVEPGDHESWCYKGISLHNLGRCEEAIFSFDRAIEIKFDEYFYWYGKGFVLFSIDNYSAALTTWQQTFNIIHQTTDRPYDVANLIKLFIRILIPKFTQPSVKTMLTELVQTYIQTSVLTELGTALVRTLKQILAPDISDYTAQKWLALWQELLGERPEMQLPFRLMTTAILYKQHPERKERLWLGLASEERSILDEALE
jgi:tetratricopeptide (TPR) repeat protein